MVTTKDVLELACRIPCDLCTLKGGTNIEPDGGCRHRPNHERFRLEALSRLAGLLGVKFRGMHWEPGTFTMIVGQEALDAMDEADRQADERYKEACAREDELLRHDKD